MTPKVGHESSFAFSVQENIDSSPNFLHPSGGNLYRHGGVMADSSDYTVLSFVTRDQSGKLNFWNPERPEGWAHSCRLGREYASELREFIRESENTETFGYVMRAITTAGVYDAVENGFCSQLGIILAGIGIWSVEPVALRHAAGDQVEPVVR